MHRWLIALVVASSAASASLAEPLFHASSPRELAYQVDTVVVARSTDAGQPTRFKVERCLKGKLQAGQVIQVEGLLPLFAGADRAYRRQPECGVPVPEGATGWRWLSPGADRHHLPEPEPRRLSSHARG